MPRNKVALDNFAKMLKNPSHDKYVSVYDDKKGALPVTKPKKEKVTLAKLAKIVNDGFKQVNTRLDRVERRLDYVIKANNLRDIKQ